jgi:hypothetical protein
MVDGAQQAEAQRGARDLHPRGCANQASWVECWCWAIVGKKRKEWAAHKKSESWWRARPVGEYGPRGFWKILKTCLFPILIQIEIRFEFFMSSTQTLN